MADPALAVHPRPTLRLRAVVAYSRLIESLSRHHRIMRLVGAASRAHGRLRGRRLHGSARRCPCCGGGFERMARRRFTGWGGVCPRCGSFSRHRTLALLLEQRRLAPSGGVALHFAPEPLLDPVFARRPDLRRSTADLQGPADLRLDITDIDLPDASFDLIICLHVLEHVPDDRAAFAELLRVLRPGGTALIGVPFRPTAPTYEDPSITTPIGRMVAFGQHDHVRVYGAGLEQRVREAGFEVEVRTVSELFDPETIERCELVAGEHFFFCVRPGGAGGERKAIAATPGADAGGRRLRRSRRHAGGVSR